MRVVLLLLALVAASPIGANPSLLETSVTVPGFGIYAITAADGVVFSPDGIRSEPRNTGLPVKVVYPFDEIEYREVLDLSVDPLEPLRLAASTDSGIYRSEDGGRSWRAIPVSSPVSKVEVFTAIARVPGNAEAFYIGTSFNGLYRTANGGVAWEHLGKSIPSFYLGAGFYEEIRSVVVSPVDPRTVVVAAGFGGALLVSRDGGVSFTGLAGPADTEIIDLSFATTNDERKESLLVVSTATDRYVAAVPAGAARGPIGPFSHSGGREVERFREPSEPKRPDPLVSGRTGIYANAGFASGERLASHLALLAVQGMNSIVVDMKDDTGNLAYDTSLELPREIGAVRQRFRLDELVEAVHEAGIYLIGRVVVFQDPKLYRYDEGRYAAWNPSADAPWGNLIAVTDSSGKVVRREQREFWVDPYSEVVWEYHIAIAEELFERGVDEVQFDYIRFPSDGDLSTIEYRYAREGMSKTDALESFLKKARRELTGPIGIDIYGFNGWYRMGNWIGQNIVVLSRWVDVISPMYYPSHYPRAFLANLDRFSRSRAIYERGSDRAAALVEGKSVIRPYVQAFLIGSERAYEENEYDEYLVSQLAGVVASKASGFTLWNASNNYYMIVSPLAEFTGGGAATR